jgi:MYXO-CTERM domain-containing protein
VNGVCTRPCDYDCPGGYECAEDEIPGGLCRPLSCADDESICDEDWNCVYSPAERNVCAREPKPACSCVVGGDADAGDPMKALALVGLLGVLSRRRRAPRL